MLEASLLAYGERRRRDYALEIARYRRLLERLGFSPQQIAGKLGALARRRRSSVSELMRQRNDIVGPLHGRVVSQWITLRRWHDMREQEFIEFMEAAASLGFDQTFAKDVFYSPDIDAG